MAGMETLGRLCNVIPIAAGAPFKFRSASVVMVVVTGAAAVCTLNQDSSFGGGFATALPAIKNLYWSTSTNGTTGWNKVTYVNGVGIFNNGPISTFTNGTTAGLTTAVTTLFHIYTSELSDPFNYMKVTMGGAGLCSVYLGDLVHQRGPANLEVLGS